MKTNTKEILTNALKPLNVQVVTFAEFNGDDDDGPMQECDLCTNLIPEDQELCEACQCKVDQESDDEYAEHCFEIDRQLGRR